MKPGVRVTGGAFRGRGLLVPPGARPTEGRVREALFSIWRDRLDGSRFLDLFAGSGVIGLEAAGRGALSVLCVDEGIAAVRAISANAARLGEALLTVRRLTLPAALPRLVEEAPFDLIFADPPYGFAAYDELLSGLPPLLAADPAAEIAGALVRVDARRYGESTLSFYRADPDILHERPG